MPEWDSHQQELDELLAASLSLAAIRGELNHVLTPESTSQEVAEVKAILAETGGRRNRLLSGKYRQARSALSQICISKPPSELADQLSLLDAIMHSQE